MTECGKCLTWEGVFKNLTTLENQRDLPCLQGSLPRKDSIRSLLDLEGLWCSELPDTLEGKCMGSALKGDGSEMLRQPASKTYLKPAEGKCLGHNTA